MSPSESKSHPSGYFDLLDACRQPGCPVCRLGSRSVRRYLDALFYEYVNDTGTRESLLDSLGFCREHVGLLLETRIADGLGASIIYENIIKKILRNFPEVAEARTGRSEEGKGFANKFLAATRKSGACPACARQETTASLIIDELVQALGDDRLREALEGSDGLCFPHLQTALERLHGGRDAEFVLGLTRKKLERLQANLAELIRKNDYRFRSEGLTEEEALAWRKAMRLISGAGTGRGESDEI